MATKRGKKSMWYKQLLYSFFFSTLNSNYFQGKLVNCEFAIARQSFEIFWYRVTPCKYSKY